MIDDSLSRRLLIYAGATGAIGVTAGALGAHYLPTVLADMAIEPDLISKRVGQFDTAVRYQLIHAVALLGLAGIPFGSPFIRHWVARCFLLGIILFSGSLYALVFSGFTKLGMVTPIGGLSLILGWCLLVFAAQKSNGG